MFYVQAVAFSVTSITDKVKIKGYNMESVLGLVWSVKDLFFCMCMPVKYYD